MSVPQLTMSPSQVCETLGEPPPVKPMVLDVAELLELDIPPRPILLGPWLTGQSLNMIHAWRGVGKTHLSLGIAFATASGGEIFGWKAPEPHRVLFLDGEMPAVALQQRVARLVEASPKQPEPGMLRFLTPDLQPQGMPNLASPEGQQLIEPLVENVELIIVDNLATLARGGRENETESWQPIAAWALQQRSAGRAVVFVHHSGKGGTQRGTSAREDILDTVLQLKQPSDYQASEGACFEVHFSKARALRGSQVEPFEARLETLPDGRQAWACKPLSVGRDERIRSMHELGMKYRDIANEVGVGLATVHRVMKRSGDHV